VATALEKVSKHDRVWGLPIIGSGWSPNFDGVFDPDVNAMTKLFAAIDERVYVCYMLNGGGFAHWIAFRTWLFTHKLEAFRLEGEGVAYAFYDTIDELAPYFLDDTERFITSSHHPFYDVVGSYNQIWWHTGTGYAEYRSAFGRWKRISVRIFNSFVIAVGLMKKLAIRPYSASSTKVSKSSEGLYFPTISAAALDAWSKLPAVFSDGGGSSDFRLPESTSAGVEGWIEKDAFGEYNARLRVRRHGGVTPHVGSSPILNYSIQSLRWYSWLYPTSGATDDADISLYRKAGTVTQAEMKSLVGLSSIASWTTDTSIASHGVYQDLLVGDYDFSDPSANSYVLVSQEAMPTHPADRGHYGYLHNAYNYIGGSLRDPLSPTNKASSDYLVATINWGYEEAV